MHSAKTLECLQSAAAAVPGGYDIEKVWWELPRTIIYSGRRKVDELRVLIKLLKFNPPSDLPANWFEREHRISQALRATCAVKSFACEQTARGSALVYADAGARPLEELLATAPLDIISALTISAKIAEAVGALHNERVIHCNLNPTTVWWDSKGTALISDFGCARHPASETSAALLTCNEMMDVRYISPEQTGRIPKTVNQRTDIYSLGVILFRLLTGKVPFDGLDPLHIIDCHLSKQPVFPVEGPGALPSTLIKVTLKALSKSPDARYLSANGLAADLLECISQLRSSGAVGTFEPGRHDVQGVVRFSQRLYGRERETETLLEKARAEKRSPPAMLLIKGAPGVGKSAFINQLEEFIRKKSGRFISGKFDQYKRNVPYLALIEAFQQLIDQILSDTEEHIQAWRSQILNALGRNSRVVIDIIPKLELITGAQPPVPTLPPNQHRNRFNRIFTKLIQAFASQDRLLCVVMDDLQWVDAASLGLLIHVLEDPNTTNLLFVGAYRDNEIGPTHPLDLTIRALKESTVDIQLLRLEELKQSEVLQLVQETFRCCQAEAFELAQVLHMRTGGNPLYLRQLLLFLCDEGFIKFDYRIGKWLWDLPRIQQEGVTQDVLDLLKLRLSALYQDARAIMATAACVGGKFQVGKVAIAANRPPSDVLDCVATAVEQGLVVSVDDRSGASAPDQPFAAQFRFLHDRIQQAAFDCTLDEDKKEFRLQIGRRLMASLGPEDELVPQPDVLSNLNYAWELIACEEERHRVARLNLVAARWARQALAYQDSLSYISVGLGLLGDKAWQTCHDLAFNLHSEALECEYLMGNFDRADHFFSVLLANANSKLEKSRTYLTKILLETSEERYEHAINVGVEALKLFDVRYLRNPSRTDLLIEWVLARLRLRGRKPQELFDGPALVDAERLAALRTLVALIPTAYFLSPELLTLTGLKVVNFSLKHGISPLSASGFAIYGLSLGEVVDDHKRGYDFGRFALDLAERSKDSSIICKVLFLFAAFIKPWRDPVDETFPLFDRARKMSLEVGDHQYVNYTNISGSFGRWSRGSNLSDLLRECDEQRPFVLQSKDAYTAEALNIVNNGVLALQGETLVPYSLDTSSYDQIASERRYRRSGNKNLVSLQNMVRLELACIFGRYQDAISLSDKGEAVIRSAPGYIGIADHYLYRGLAAAVALTEQHLEPARLRRTLKQCLARLHHFADNNPRNFLQHKSLLEGEASRVRGQLANALKHYDRAIELSESEGYTHLVGLANERAALCCLANEQRRLATWYLSCSRTAYERWGASAKVSWLDRDYEGLITAGADRLQKSAQPRGNFPIHHQGESFDISAALQASHIIASGENSDQVLNHLIQVIRIQVGAETAQLLAFEGDNFRPYVSAKADSNAAVMLQSSPVDACLDSFSPAIVNYVRHTGEDLILADADADPRFAQCPYIANRHPKSVICTCVQHQGEFLGIVYLEHTRIVGAFNEQKLGWLQLLTTEVGLEVWSGKVSRYRDYLRRLAPAAVSEEIEANPKGPNLAQEDSDISILFADLAGYTRMAELMETRELDDLINRTFSRFVDEIHRYQGTVLEIHGDELFVLFRDEDRSAHALRAGLAALAISRAAVLLNEEQSAAPLPLVMNMGISSGIASIGLKSIEASSGPAWHYGASGQVVNIAARIRELARDGSILISSDSATRVPNRFVLEDMGEHMLKNLSKRTHIYRLVSERKT